MSTIFFGSHELGNPIAFIAACGPYARNDGHGLRIYARIAADYSAYNARAWQIRYLEPIVAAVPHDERALLCACPRIPDVFRAIATASLLAYNLDDFLDDPKALSAAHQLVLGVLLAVRSASRVAAISTNLTAPSAPWDRRRRASGAPRPRFGF